MSNDLLPSVEINPKQTPMASIIWLHGLGADGHDFTNIVSELKLPEQLAIRFVFPHAPVRPVTINGGYPMRAWYDIISDNFNMREDEAGVRASQAEIARLIKNESNLGIPASRILLGGFSQGGAMALHTGLRYPESLGGILALSAYLPFMPVFAKEMNPANQHTPIFMAHGAEDPLLPLQWGQTSAEFLKKHNHAVEFHTYQMPHSVCMEEIGDISKWLQQQLLPK